MNTSRHKNEPWKFFNLLNVHRFTTEPKMPWQPSYQYAWQLLGGGAGLVPSYNKKPVFTNLQLPLNQLGPLHNAFALYKLSLGEPQVNLFSMHCWLWSAFGTLSTSIDMGGLDSICLSFGKLSDRCWPLIICWLALASGTLSTAIILRKWAKPPLDFVFFSFWTAVLPTTDTQRILRGYSHGQLLT
jgi:hypothetical protein